MSEHLVQDHQRPAPLKDFLERSVRHQLQRIPLFRRSLLEGNERDAPAALGRFGPVPFVGQEMVDGDHEERTELAFAPVHLRQVVLVQQPEEELLREVLRVVRLVTPLPHVGIERVPVGAAELFQGFLRAGRRVVPGRKHDAPVGGGKPSLF